MSGEANSKYSEGMVEKAVHYLANYRQIGDEIPSHLGLADYLGIGTTTLYRWAKEEGKEAFRDILERIMTRQGKTLINKGLNGDFNSNIVKLVLGKHGYSDKQELEAKGFNLTIGNKDADNA